MKDQNLVTFVTEVPMDTWQRAFKISEEIQEPSLTNFINDAIVHYVNYWQERLAIQPPAGNDHRGSTPTDS